MTGIFEAFGIIVLFIMAGNVANEAIDYTVPKAQAAYEQTVDKAQSLFNRED